jgi:hypothetical protein
MPAVSGINCLIRSEGRFQAVTFGINLCGEGAPASGPINFLAYPVLEIGGKPTKVKVEFSFNRNTSGKL